MTRQRRDLAVCALALLLGMALGAIVLVVIPSWVIWALMYWG